MTNPRSEAWRTRGMPPQVARNALVHHEFLFERQDWPALAHLGPQGRERVQCSVKPNTFTPREREAIERLADGESYAEIGAALNLDTGTVGNICLAARRKAAARTNAELVAVALRHGVIL